MTYEIPNVTADDISFDSDSYTLDDIKSCYNDYGCFIIRGFNKKYID
ncbi:MAG: hypothetical protein HRT89_15735, partial [Lentisphaeria bacterium]|nr:hypothetical protein [Lentisphaeria bacterium]